MEISPIMMAKMLAVAFLFGIQSGVAFDIGKAIRALLLGEVKSERIRKIYSAKLPFSKRDICYRETGKRRIAKNIIIFVTDFVWVIYSAFGLVIINYAYNEGGVRFFTVVGMVAGFTLYYFTLSRLTVFFAELVCFMPRYAFLTFFDAGYLIFLNIYNNLVKKLKKRCEKLRLHIEKKRKKVYNVPEEVCENTESKNSRVSIKFTARKISRKGMRKNSEEK
jgi:hypothetical protein